MNVLIQGAASHVWLTGHHVVTAELNALPSATEGEISNTEFYDKFAAAAMLNQWNGALALVTGISTLFWRKVGTGKTPFCNHPLLVRHGKTLSATSKATVVKRCKERMVTTNPFTINGYISKLCEAARPFEATNKLDLQRLGVEATSAIWDIDSELLTAQLTEQPEFGNIRTPGTQMGKNLRQMMVGWSGAENDGGNLSVMARGKFFSVLMHELTKGTVELVSLHGLNQLDEDVFDIVMAEADQIEFEVWMIQAGLEYYRRFLMATARDGSPAAALMKVAMMPTDFLEEFSLAVVEDTSRAAAMLREFTV